jgi:hypothetical protein
MPATPDGKPTPERNHARGRAEHVQPVDPQAQRRRRSPRRRRDEKSLASFEPIFANVEM